MADRKLDLFKLLDAISRKQIGYYETLADDEKKEFQPFVIMRWLTGTVDKRQVYLLNAIINPVVFDIGQQHKQLMYNLLVACSSGKHQRYGWVKAPGTNRKGKLTINVICQYFGYGIRTAIDAAKLLQPEDILGYAEELGWQKEDIAKLKKELKENNK